MLSGLFSCFRAKNEGQAGVEQGVGFAYAEPHRHDTSNGRNKSHASLNQACETLTDRELYRRVSSSSVPAGQERFFPGCKDAALAIATLSATIPGLGRAYSTSSRVNRAPSGSVPASAAPPCGSRAGNGYAPPALPGRGPSASGMVLSMRTLHMAAGCAVTYMDFSQPCPPSLCSNDESLRSPIGETRPFSVDYVAPGDAAVSESSGPLSVSGLPPQLRLSSAASLAAEVQDLQPLGRGGFGMVLAGTWRQEGRVAVKVLLSDEERWMESCYKEAVLSKMLAHPNILQTYDFQAAVLTDADVAHARASWERQQQLLLMQQQQQAAAAQAWPGAAHDPLSSCVSAGYGRADSFELMPQLGSAARGSAGDGLRPGGPAGVTDLWQVLFMLGARPGQFVTLIVMEYAEVGTLQRAIGAGAFRESGRLSRWAALRSLLVTAKEVAGGMCLLHSAKIIHGDLSATNVMLRCSRIDKRGFVAKVADFGLSKVTVGGVARAESGGGGGGCCGGQVAYLAPELLGSEAAVLASDVFSFGVLLFEMAAGRRAFAEYLPAQILAGRLAGDLHLEWPADTPPALRALAERCMVAAPRERPSFREVAEELRRQDMEAKAAHRQYTMLRRASAEGPSAAAMLAGALNGLALGAPGSYGTPFGPSTAPYCDAVTAAAAAAVAEAAPPALGPPLVSSAGSPCCPLTPPPCHAPPEFSSTFTSAPVGGSCNGSYRLLSALPSGGYPHVAAAGDAAVPVWAGSAGGAGGPPCAVPMLPGTLTLRATAPGGAATRADDATAAAAALCDAPAAELPACPRGASACLGALEPIASGELLVG